MRLHQLRAESEPLLPDLMVLIEEVIWYRETLLYLDSTSSTCIGMYCLIETLSTLATTTGKFLYMEMKKSFIEIFFSKCDRQALDEMSPSFKSTSNGEELSRDSPLTRGTLNEGKCLLGRALEMGAHTTVKVLLDRGVIPSQNTVCTVIKSPSSNQLLEILYPTDITDKHPTADGVPLIELIAEHGRPDTMKLFIKHIEPHLNNITGRGETLLHCAIRGRNHDMMHFLSSKGAKDLVNAGGQAPAA